MNGPRRMPRPYAGCPAAIHPSFLIIHAFTTSLFMKTKTLLFLALAALSLTTACHKAAHEVPNITLTVDPGRKIFLSFAGKTDTTSIRIQCGKLDTTFIIGKKRTPARYFIADDEKMTIRGEVTAFNCSTNGGGITAIDCSRDTMLRSLECHDNALTELNVGGCSGLRILECYSNRLTTLDVSRCPSLERLNCSDNLLTALDLSKCPKLEMIACINNGLTKLDVTMCRKLSVLYCYRNKLTELQLRGCAWLTELSCGKNYLPNLDFSGCNSLRTAYCCDNDFSYAATEELYRSLPDRTGEDEPGHIFILNEDALPAGRTRAGNEGIATQKHWEVLWCRGDW